MKIAHLTNYSPSLSGMYGSVRDLVLSERKIKGVEAEVIDDARMLQSEYGKDGITPVSTMYAEDADVICWHHSMIESYFNEKHRNLILFLHGTPEFNLFTELYSGDNVLSLLVGLANNDIPKAYITMWKRHVPFWEQMLNKKVHYVPAWAQLDMFRKSKKKVNKNKITIALMDFWRPSREPFGIIHAIAHLRDNSKKKIEVNVWGLPEHPSKTWLAVMQWLVEDGTMILRGNSHNVQEEIFDKNDMILTMSTEETRVVRESASAGVPVVCGRAGMHFTKYSADGIYPDKLAEQIDKCHEDLCKNQKKVREDLRKYAESNFDSDRAAIQVIDIFKGVIKEYGSVNAPKTKKRVNSIKQTADRITNRLSMNETIAFVPFDEDSIELLKGKGRIPTELKKAFKYQDKTRGYFVSSVAGMHSEGRMRPYLFGPSRDDDKLIKIVDKMRPNHVFDNANTLAYLSVYDPTWFVDFLRKYIHNTRVMFIGDEDTCSSAVVKNAFDVDTFIASPHSEAAQFLGENWKDIELKAQRHDTIICSGLGSYAPIIAYRLWSRGFRINFFDIEYIANAMCRSSFCPWLDSVDETFQENYESSFVPTSTDIIIPTHNASDVVSECFKGISDNTTDYRVIWVDNGSVAENVEEMKGAAQSLEDCDAIFNDENEGYSRAVNKAIKKSFIDCSADWVALVDSDVLVTKNWLSNLISAAIANDLDLISPLMSEGNALSVDNLRGTLKSLPEFKPEQNYLERAEILNSQYGTSVAESATVSLSCCVMKRELIEQIGLFDESIFMYGEDTDYFNRILRMGRKAGIALGSYVHHDVGSTASLMGEDWISKQKKTSKTYLNKKWLNVPSIGDK